MNLKHSNRPVKSGLRARPANRAGKPALIAVLALLALMILSACDATGLTIAPAASNSTGATGASSAQSTPGNSSGSGAQGSISTPTPGGSSSTAPSTGTVNAIKAVIEKGNQEEVQAFASHNPSVMADTSTTTYYQQMAQSYSDMVNSGVSAIKLENLTWGNVTLQDANTAQANTTETWQTTYSDGSTTQDTNANIYTLVLQNGSWKVQGDQQPSTRTLQPEPGNQGNPTAPANPITPPGQGGRGATPTPAAPSSNSTTPSASTISAIKAVIEKGNQEEVQAFASHNPSVMADTSTSSYYQQMTQSFNNMANSGVTGLKLANLTWGNITLQNATTAQANTTETWVVTYSDGSTTQGTNANVYTLVLQNGAWKVQDDQQQSGSQGQTPGSTAPNPSVPSAPSTPSPSAPSSTAPSTSTVNAIKAVIEKGNQEEVQAFTSHNPSVMADTSTSSYYRQMSQNYSDMSNAGISSIKLLNLTWGDVTLQNANTAIANTTETWSTTYSDGSTTQDTNANIYTLVLQNGSWKIQDDQQPNGSGGQGTSPTIPGTTPPNPVSPVAPTSPGTSVDQSSNWAGYAATGGTFTSISGTWTVPNVSAGNGYNVAADATWVGIGGVNSTDLIQAGTQAMVQGGQVQYSAWWETLPQASVQVPLDVNAGDSVNVTINQQAGGTWLIVIRDVTNGQSFQKSVTYRSSLSSAEWIEEAPSAGRGMLPLDQFGTVNFTRGTATENGKQVTIAQAGGKPISMYGSGTSGFGRRGGGFGQPSGQSSAQPSALGSDGSSFSVTRTGG